MKITDITRTKRGRYAIHVDGEFLFSAEEEALLRSGLKAGDEAGIEDLEALRRSSEYIFGREKAFRLLERKAYTRRMLVEKLRSLIDEDTAEAVAGRMCELGLIDDGDYAATYARDLFRVKGYSRQHIARALKQRGIGEEEAKAALAQFDEGDAEERLLTLIRKKYARYLGDEKGRQRAVNALLRMGYRYGEIRPAIEQVLEEDGIDGELAYEQSV